MTQSAPIQARILVALLRERAAAAAARDDLSAGEKCALVGRGAIEILSGLDPRFPACTLAANPHPDDEAYLRNEGSPWWPAGLEAEGLLDYYDARVADGAWLEDRGGARPREAAELTHLLARTIRAYALYWAEDKAPPRPGSPAAEMGMMPDNSDAAKAHGTAFSILAALDGSSTNVPMIDVVPRAEAIEASPERFGAFRAAPIDVELHALYHDGPSIEGLIAHPSEGDFAP